MQEKELESIAVLKALADPMRLEMLARFVSSDRVQSSELQGGCPRSQPTVSHHLAKLVEVGLLIEEKQGTQKSYLLNTPLLARFGIDLSLITN